MHAGQPLLNVTMADDENQAPVVTTDTEPVPAKAASSSPRTRQLNKICCLSVTVLILSSIAIIVGSVAMTQSDHFTVVANSVGVAGLLCLFTALLSFCYVNMAKAVPTTEMLPTKVRCMNRCISVSIAFGLVFLIVGLGLGGVWATLEAFGVGVSSLYTEDSDTEKEANKALVILSVSSLIIICLLGIVFIILSCAYCSKNLGYEYVGRYLVYTGVDVTGVDVEMERNIAHAALVEAGVARYPGTASEFHDAQRRAQSSPRPPAVSAGGRGDDVRGNDGDHLRPGRYSNRDRSPSPRYDRPRDRSPRAYDDRQRDRSPRPPDDRPRYGGPRDDRPPRDRSPYDDRRPRDRSPRPYDRDRPRDRSPDNKDRPKDERSYDRDRPRDQRPYDRGPPRDRSPRPRDRPRDRSPDRDRTRDHGPYDRDRPSDRRPYHRNPPIDSDRPRDHSPRYRDHSPYDRDRPRDRGPRDSDRSRDGRPYDDRPRDRGDRRPRGDWPGDGSGRDTPTSGRPSPVPSAPPIEIEPPPSYNEAISEEM